MEPSYKIISQEHAIDAENKVNMLIAEGWRTKGELIVSVISRARPGEKLNDKFETLYTQVMVKI